MNKGTFRFKNWLVKYALWDGARIGRLRYRGIDLLTTTPDVFIPPVKDYGAYERRPVFGYDDCFPSVSACRYPGLDWEVPDHGEVCWLPWNVSEKPDCLSFSVESGKLPMVLRRELHFSEDTLTWAFEVCNREGKTLPVQHVIHPLMPLKDIAGLQIPGFTSVFDDIHQSFLDITTPGRLQDFLLEQPEGTASMLFLRGVGNGKIVLEFISGLKLEMIFPSELFPTLGVWWNNSGYPDEEGIRRNECAFEPVPGSDTSLETAHREGTCLYLPPYGRVNWTIEWKISMQ